jgi:hypothetical protein
MKVLTDSDGVVTVELTRRNLEALMAKLDGYPEGSACTICAGTSQGGPLLVKAVENAAHYGDRPPGALHRDTEGRVG